MAATSIPHFRNDAGLPVIRVAAKEFMCIGAKPPFDHPHIFLDMGSETEIVCPYCSTLFRYDGSLSHAICAPPDALWHDSRAA
ncbi:MAG: zinc-finger domain-containing protein [Methylobacterium sp.]|uniref:zinc-finger domain-containing protein n=1 Tax=Rhabdaerophilum sp. TaxID=2717341 RepID=UPI002A1B38AB|nr:zinc-finger domain-containing protein [Methylobacterium sp.]MCA3657166.1 zinc-finger domain-containing protein [Methylobacterium sp.]MCA3661011.1 zinc-finger domain-containing protein [Methylobacterium sp.]MCA3671997.1 zinc-finger domain-containing protein [Methylobacterium sp.]MCA3674424.1 zinc-finger domain-containing protein [Methylobacterium sp.]